jgi:hypothetical protein
METYELSAYHSLVLNWLDQYHREHPDNGDVVAKLRYLKEKLAEANIRGCIKPTSSIVN